MCEENENNVSTLPVVCNGMTRLKKCRTELTNNGVNGSGFCEACWYPNINEDYDSFKNYREEGYGREAAGVMAGIFDPSEEPENKVRDSVVKLHGIKKRY